MLNLSKFSFLCLSLCLIFLASCGDDDVIGTCSDGILNQNETAIDCGGSCSACATCSDGIMNGTETGIDCGGDCDPCPTCTDGIMNGDETGIDCGGDCDPCFVFTEHMTAEFDGVAFAASSVSGVVNGGIVFASSNQTTSGQLTIAVPPGAALGTYDLGVSPSYSMSYFSPSFDAYAAPSGTITITYVDETNKEIGGTFETTLVNQFGSNSDIIVTNGSFGVEY